MIFHGNLRRKIASPSNPKPPSSEIRQALKRPYCSEIWLLVVKKIPENGGGIHGGLGLLDSHELCTMPGWLQPPQVVSWCGLVQPNDYHYHMIIIYHS